MESGNGPAVADAEKLLEPIDGHAMAPGGGSWDRISRSSATRSSRRGGLRPSGRWCGGGSGRVYRRSGPKALWTEDGGGAAVLAVGEGEPREQPSEVAVVGRTVEDGEGPS
jgi:hypothetical protein